MKNIRIHFTDFWSGFDNENNFIVNLLKKDFNIIFDAENPEYLFYSSFGFRHFNYSSSVKIYFTGENDVPDFNICDYGIGSSYIDFEGRYFRLPLFCLYKSFNDILNKNISEEIVLQRNFCNFIYSNNLLSDPIRADFFHQLSHYKKVDSGGKYLNNIGRKISDKLEFIRDYKFTIAFENSSLTGYTTEKLIDPMAVNSMPVYWGNDKLERDFNTQSFIYINDKRKIKDAIEEIIYLDENDNAYLEKIKLPWIKNRELINWENHLLLFLKTIIEKEYLEAKKTTDFGFVQRYKKKQMASEKLFSYSLFRKIFK